MSSGPGFFSLQKPPDILPVTKGGEKGKRDEKNDIRKRKSHKKGKDGEAPEGKKGGKGNIPFRLEQQQPEKTSGGCEEEGERGVQEESDAIGRGNPFASPETEP